MVDYVRRHVGLGTARKRTARPKWVRVLVLGAALLVLGVLLYAVSPLLGLFMLVLVINALLEQHKLYTQRAPVDIEILSVAAAYFSAVHGVGWGVSLALIGPLVSHGAIGYFGDATVVKMAGHVACAITAAFVPATVGWLFLAVLAGLLVQSLLFVAVLGRGLLSNLLARLTTAALALYVLFIAAHWLPG